MAIPWLIGAAVAGVVGIALASDDDSSSSSSSGSRELEREQERAERDRQQKREQAERIAQERRQKNQKCAEAQRFIKKHNLNIKAQKLVTAAENGDLSSVVMSAHQSTVKYKKRDKQIKQLTTQFEQIQKLECELKQL